MEHQRKTNSIQNKLCFQNKLLLEIVNELYSVFWNQSHIKGELFLAKRGYNELDRSIY